MSARGLGRGFDDLIPTDLIDDEFDPTVSEDDKLSKLQEIELSKIVRDENQPRRKFSSESLEALAGSIKEHGVLQPIVATKEGDKYKIVAGERRWRAAQAVGLKTIPTIVRTLDAQNRLELSIIENAQREDLNAIELATAYTKLKTQFDLSNKEIAKRVGKSEVSIVNTMRLLNLSENVKKAMVEHNLSESVMRPMIKVDQKLVEEILPKIVSEGWTARKAERYAADHKERSSFQYVKDNHFLHEEEALREKYKVYVRIHGRSLTMSCKNEEEMEQLIKKLSK